MEKAQSQGAGALKAWPFGDRGRGNGVDGMGTSSVWQNHRLDSGEETAEWGWPTSTGTDSPWRVRGTSQFSMLGWL